MRDAIGLREEIGVGPAQAGGRARDAVAPPRAIAPPSSSSRVERSRVLELGQVEDEVRPSARSAAGVARERVDVRGRVIGASRSARRADDQRCTSVAPS
jgi:hypothetical protein